MVARDAAGFGEVLRRYRTAAALSQEALADRTGLSARGISDLERGIRRAPSHGARPPRTPPIDRRCPAHRRR